ncbi:MAG TPA: hypothetical protein VMU84_09285 [Thermoanaerobaculia bacterium]|nr:hypothetical protein [Thermoanaerobaculia bacterium]
MAQASIRFVGLCVHLQHVTAPGIGVPHRVVMLSNSTPNRGSHLVEQHRPALIRPNGDSEFLTGVSLTIVNGTSEELQYDGTWEAIPHLKEPGALTPPLNTGVAYDQRSPAAAYFDIDAGTLCACTATKGGAIAARLEFGIGDETGLLLTYWDGREPDWIPLADGDKVLITNVAAHGVDDKWDYLLNYDIVASPILQQEPKLYMPQVAPPPMCEPSPHIQHFDLGPMCSNSNYP